MGVVKKKALLKPLAQREDHYSLFLMGDDDTTLPIYMPAVSLKFVEWPRRLVVWEPMGNALVLADLPDGVNIELTRIPGNRSRDDYQVGTPLMRFDKCVKMRQFSLFKSGGLELGVVFDCTIDIL